MAVSLVKPVSLVKRAPKIGDLSNLGSGPLRTIGGHSLVRQPARVIFFTGGSLLRFVVVRPTPDGTRSLARHRSGDTIVLPSELPARDVADGWELRARRAGVYAGQTVVR